MSEPSTAEAGKETPSANEAADSVVLEEEIDPNYVPSEAEVLEYATWLGMDLEKDTDLYWIAREGTFYHICTFCSFGEYIILYDDERFDGAVTQELETL